MIEQTIRLAPTSKLDSSQSARSISDANEVVPYHDQIPRFLQVLTLATSFHVVAFCASEASKHLIGRKDGRNITLCGAGLEAGGSEL